MSPLLPPVGSLAPKPMRTADARQLKQAGEEFESLLITHLLKTARDSGGWLGSGADPSMGSMVEFAEEQLAKVLVSQGGLGLTQMVSQSLAKAEQQTKNSAAMADKESR